VGGSCVVTEMARYSTQLINRWSARSGYPLRKVRLSSGDLRVIPCQDADRLLSPDKSDGARACLAPPRFGSIRMLQRLFQRRQPGGCHLLVLLRGDPRNPDRPDELAIDHNRQSALDRNRVAQSQNGIAPPGDGVFEQLG
jgi:hypothetical protein